MERFKVLIYDIKAGQKLGDDHINAVNQLLHDQFEDFQGLSTPVLGQKLLFQKFDWMAGSAGFGYFQILHTGEDHWITVKLLSDHEVLIYDSIHLKPSYYSLKQIASIAQCKASTIELQLQRVQIQRPGSVDCGVYALAFLTDLCHGKDPASCQYANAVELRNHLIACLESGQMLPFPSHDITKKNALIMKLNVYCNCRLPHALEHLKCPPTGEATTMIKCYICDDLYHHSCVGITLERAKKMNAVKEMWFCDYKGCEEAFGDLFDSD